MEVTMGKDRTQAAATSSSRRRAMPAMPIRAEPNSQAAAGTGTAAGARLPVLLSL